jgi:hypothetical protein
MSGNDRPTYEGPERRARRGLLTREDGSWHPAVNWAIVATVFLAALAAAFNLGQQWNRQDRITEITADLKSRDELLPARVMKDRYDIYERIIADMQAKIAFGSVRDAEINGHIENLTGRLEQVARREAAVTQAHAELMAAHARTDARLDMLIKQVSVHDEHDFQMERGEAHPH